MRRYFFTIYTIFQKVYRLFLNFENIFLNTYSIFVSYDKFSVFFSKTQSSSQSPPQSSHSQSSTGSPQSSHSSSYSHGSCDFSVVFFFVELSFEVPNSQSKSPISISFMFIISYSQSICNSSEKVFFLRIFKFSLFHTKQRLLIIFITINRVLAKE